MLVRFLVPLLLGMLLAGRAVAAAEPPVAGSWEGRLVLGDAGLRLLFNFTADSQGRLTGTLDSPDQGAYGIALDSVTFRERVLRCEVKRISGVYANLIDRSIACTCLVRPPTEMKSTPVSATARSVSSDMLPDASSSVRAFAC